MGPKYAIVEGAVGKLSTNLDTAVGMLKAQAAAFKTSIEPLESEWEGTSFGSWSELTTAWDEAMANLNSALDTIKSSVGDAAALYDQHHAEQAASLQATMASANWRSTTA